MSDSSDIDPAAVRARLIARRGEIEAMAGASAEARGTVELDQQRVGRLSRMDALQGQAMAREVERRREVELLRIAAALARLDEGEYGYCLGCGEEIGARRLETDPTAPTCIGCARKAK